MLKKIISFLLILQCPLFFDTLHSNNNFNNDPILSIEETPAFNPENFGQLLEGTFNYVFYDPSLETYKTKGGTTALKDAYNIYSYYERGTVSESVKNKFLKQVKFNIVRYFSDVNQSIKGYSSIIRSANKFYSKINTTDKLKENYCLSLLFGFNEKSIKIYYSDKGRNLHLSNLKLTARTCNGEIFELLIPEMKFTKKRSRLPFYPSSIRNKVYSALDQVIRPMNLDPNLYYPKYTPKLSRIFLTINGKELSDDRVIAEEELKNYLKNRPKSLEGIYLKKYATDKSPKYKVAILKPDPSAMYDFYKTTSSDSDPDIYLGVYISGATENKANWECGDMKFVFGSTLKENYYKVSYLMSEKSVNSNSAISFGYQKNTSNNSMSVWKSDDPKSRYFQGVNISVNREDNLEWVKEDYYDRIFPRNYKPSSYSTKKRYSKSKSTKPKAKSGVKKAKKINN